MYWFKVELTDELLDGRTKISIAKKIGLSKPTILSILNGKSGTRCTTAYAIIKTCRPEANIEDYFYKKGE